MNWDFPIGPGHFGANGRCSNHSCSCIKYFSFGFDHKLQDCELCIKLHGGRNHSISMQL